MPKYFIDFWSQCVCKLRGLYLFIRNQNNYQFVLERSCTLTVLEMRTSSVDSNCFALTNKKEQFVYFFRTLIRPSSSNTFVKLSRIFCTCDSAHSVLFQFPKRKGDI